MRGVLTVSLATVLAVGTACTNEPAGRSEPPPPVQTTQTTRSAPTLTMREFDADRAMATVRLLAGRVGPRLATAPGYDAAVALLWPRLVRAGYDVRRQRFPVHAGDSWGVPVAGGT